MKEQYDENLNGLEPEILEKESVEMNHPVTEDIETDYIDTEDFDEEEFESDDYETKEDDDDFLPDDLADFIDNETPSFTRLSDKYADIMSSATTMLVVGVLGIAFLILVWCKVIPLPLSSSTMWLFDSVMGGIFVIFVIAGILSFMRAKQVKIDAQAEDELIARIQDWSADAFTKEELDRELDLTQPVEILYFSRSEKIKDALMHEFEEANEALIAEMAEDIYQRLYEE